MAGKCEAASLTDQVVASLRASFAAGARSEDPYRHWIVRDVFPSDLAARLGALPFPTVDLAGVSGKRELHNDQRRYFDAANQARFAECAAVVGAFQSREIVSAIQESTGADLAGSFVRLEYAQDTDGFWLEPHTDLGVKTFTMLIYLASGGGQEGIGQEDWGTDIYRDRATWAKRTPFTPNSALVFVPGLNTWHGLERRAIGGVRRSVIMNYVTADWRERGQLAYPDRPVRA